MMEFVWRSRMLKIGGTLSSSCCNSAKEMSELLEPSRAQYTSTSNERTAMKTLNTASGQGSASWVFMCFLMSFVLIPPSSAFNSDNVSCDCHDDGGFWRLEALLACQGWSDLAIAIWSFFMPFLLVCFLRSSKFPLKCVLLQYIGVVVLCALTHFINAWNYFRPLSFRWMLVLTIAKFLLALVSTLNVITNWIVIPLLLKVKVRESFLKQNAWELDEEVRIVKNQRDTSWDVTMLTREIRKSLDKHTIFNTTIIGLSRILGLHNCAVWIPDDDEDRANINLAHELINPQNYHLPIPLDDPDVLEILGSSGIKVLSSDSPLGAASSGGSEASGEVVAIRLPIPQVSDFSDGTTELENTYGILVLVLPGWNCLGWGCWEREIVEVAIDQVAVTLSHVAVLEESRLAIEKLSAQNLLIQQETKNAMVASQACDMFQKVMSQAMRKHRHSILGDLSMLQHKNMDVQQRIIFGELVRYGNDLSNSIDDALKISRKAEVAR